jgi:hypothetical protein
MAWFLPVCFAEIKNFLSPYNSITMIMKFNKNMGRFTTIFAKKNKKSQSFTRISPQNCPQVW